ncbi:putative clathrin heavy chain 1 [Apostichopus japonicus]|uniref:Putative clathrin heavy chain 1 n=1 Tax=Stichopus japonicus TaxID=307972 RepID=A0A2G8KFD0_STIJA|nr:putative clathrin heavy chain 1 [Apostichopus japonicus]
MSSHRWLCCRHTSKKKKRDNCVTVINLTSRTPRPKTWPCTADSAIMNPRKPWLALKLGRHFQIFNIVAEKQMYRCTMKDEVQYWTWLNEDVIGMVGSKFTYHWDLSPPTGFSRPVRAFARHPKLNFCQIVAYKTDPSFRWFAVVGLYREYDDGDANSVCGVTQVYSAHYNHSIPIDAQAATFAKYLRKGNQKPTSLLVLAHRSAGQPGKIHIIELGPFISGNYSLTNNTEQLLFDDKSFYDFPVCVQVSTTQGLVYVFTKSGMVKVSDIQTGLYLCSARVSHMAVFTAITDVEEKRIVALDRCGKLLAIKIKEEALLTHVKEKMKKRIVADQLEKSFAKE